MRGQPGMVNLLNGTATHSLICEMGLTAEHERAAVKERRSFFRERRSRAALIFLRTRVERSSFLHRGAQN